MNGFYYMSFGALYDTFTWYKGGCAFLMLAYFCLINHLCNEAVNNSDYIASNNGWWKWLGMIMEQSCDKPI
jgi:hypothetical protein